MKIKSIDLMFPIKLVVSLVLGFTGLVDWWVIVLMRIFYLEFTLTFKD